ncbi:MAG: sigma-54 dependent transcriptional regulator [Verrucomicrobiales bacterium]|nr:sigma-54 dependent transcriptional regulator [Verrucomicrobiales bacterium]
MAKAKRLLVVDDDPETAEAVAVALRDTDLRVMSVPSINEGEEEVQHREFIAVIINLDFPDGEGFSFIKAIHRTHPQLAAIGISASSESRMAIEAVKSGAFDFISKPIHGPDIVKAVKEAVTCAQKSSEPVAIDPTNELTDTTDSLVGNSRAMLDVYKALGRLSPTPVTVLIRGETGTGKELVARALFQHGHRAHRAFITVNCAAIPENLLESELFGHEKGAFTGAVTTRIGKFEQANGATLFLDEIGDLDLALQAKMLRVLQEKRFQRVGGSEEISVDVRIIAATHRNLDKMIAEGDFREDLFYRLNVATIKLPPLRDRTGDVALLTNFFLGRYGTELGVPSVSMTRNAVSRLESARLPGNVRQLQNIVRKALLRSRGYAIDRDMIEELLIETEPPDQSRSDNHSVEDFCRQLLNDAAEEKIENAHQVAVETIETALIDLALKKSDGNISKASKWLGLSRLTVREKAKKYGITDSN